jgi:MoaA/NifB/PqqE/SkfB family radical SAM enzyme
MLIVLESNLNKFYLHFFNNSLNIVHKKTHEQVRKLRSLVQENVENKEASMTKGIRNTRRTKTSKSVLKNCSSLDVTNNNKYQVNSVFYLNNIFFYDIMIYFKHYNNHIFHRSQ